jgi:hypothetical protein
VSCDYIRVVVARDSADGGQVIGRGRPHPGPLKARRLHDPASQEYRRLTQHPLEQSPVHEVILATELEDA